jgi:hypothetical protein
MQQTSRSLSLTVLTAATIALSQPAASFDFSPGRWMSPGNWFGGSRDDDYYYGGPRGYYAPPPGYYQAPPLGYGYGQPAYQAPAQPYGTQPAYQAPAQSYGAQPAYQAPAQSYGAQPAYQAPAQSYGAQPAYGAQQTYQAPAQPYQAPAAAGRQVYQAPQSAPPRSETTRTAAPAYPPMEEPLPGSGGYVPEGYLSDIPDEYPMGTYVPEGYLADVPDDGAPAAAGYPPMEEPAGEGDSYVPHNYSAASE